MGAPRRRGRSAAHPVRRPRGERAIGRLEFARLVSPARLEVANHTEGERRGLGHQLHLHEDKDERKEAARHLAAQTRSVGAVLSRVTAAQKRGMSSAHREARRLGHQRRINRKARRAQPRQFNEDRRRHKRCKGGRRDSVDKQERLEATGGGKGGGTEVSPRSRRRERDRRCVAAPLAAPSLRSAPSSASKSATRAFVSMSAP